MENVPYSNPVVLDKIPTRNPQQRTVSVIETSVEESCLNMTIELKDSPYHKLLSTKSKIYVPNSQNS